MNFDEPTRVLLIEDSPTDALLVAAALENVQGFNCELTQAELLQQGISLVQEIDPEVVLLDLGLPDSQGIESFLQLHRAAPTVPILVLTALDDLGLGLLALSEGAQDYLIKKNVQAEELGRAIRYAIGRQEAQLHLLDTRDRLRKLAKHLESSRELQRTRLSREIHDELGQKLSAIKMDFNWLQRKCAPLQPSQLSQEIGQRLESSIMLVDQVIDKVQSIAIELRPGVLDHLGLADAIRDEARRFSAHTGIFTTLSFAEPLPLVQDSDLKTAFFRIFQELQTNIFRHAQATEVVIDLRCLGESLQMMVMDNGIGMDTNLQSLATSLGLLGIQERAANLNGSFTIESTPGFGTSITVSMPFQAHHRERQ